MEVIKKRVFYNYFTKKGVKVVAIGGGTGLSTLLRSMKNLTDNITAVVAVTDDGGSSGRLRRDLGILPPGDIRNCLIALADSDHQLEKVLAYNFPEGSDIAGHNLGNLLMAGLVQMKNGDFAESVESLSNVLAVRGRVLPATVDNVIINGIMADGETVSGETEMVDDNREIKEVFLEPKNCKAMPAVLEAIAKANYVFIGPGSLYTSIITNLLVPGVAEAIKQSKARVYYVCNITTQPGEMEKTFASKYVEAISYHVGTQIIHKIIANNQELPLNCVEERINAHAQAIICDKEALEAMGLEVIMCDLVSKENSCRHDEEKLEHLLWDQFNSCGCAN